MRIPGRFRNTLLRVGSVLSLTGIAGLAASQVSVPALPAFPITALTGRSLLTAHTDDSDPNAAQVNRGRYLVAAGDCLSCHLRDGGEPFAGGLALNTPFGAIYTSNITPDRESGIGAWTSDQFFRAMHDGKGVHGENLYPAFPYPWFRRASRTDDDAIFAYLKTVPAVRYSPPKNDLPFPFSIRASVAAWNVLFLDTHDVQTDPGQSAEWNRGAYLVNGLGHCSACHTPKNSLGADKSKQAFYGGKVDNAVAPDLTRNTRIGLGAWSVEDIAEYLADGRNARAAAGAAMADVITFSTSLLTDSDRHSIAVYLKSLPTSPAVTASAADNGSMRRGAEIYSDACASCHLENGVGQSRVFPPLGGDTMLQQPDPTGVTHLILAGTEIGISTSRPSPLRMPSFAWKLTDQEIADVATFVRNSWGNQASAVSSSGVSELRKKLDLQTAHLTANSGDQN